MPEIAVIIRNRGTRRIVRIRTRQEPLMLRVCRACGKIHIAAQPACRAA